MKQNVYPVLVLGALWLGLPVCGADFTVVNSSATAYVINGTNNPTLTLVRGQTYSFSIAASGHPFWIKTNAVTGTTSAYTNGVTGNGTQTGTLTFAVPWDAPTALIYTCQFHSSMQGAILITNPPPTAALLVDPVASAPGGFSFNAVGTPGRLHSVEATSDLTGGWAVIGTTNAPPSGTFRVTDTNAATFPVRFYRVLTD